MKSQLNVRRTGSICDAWPCTYMKFGVRLIMDLLLLDIKKINLSVRRG